MALNNAREIAQQPALHALHDVVAVSIELSQCAEHAAIHQPDHRDQDGVAKLYAPNDEYVHHVGSQAKHQREQHASCHPHVAQHWQCSHRNQDAQFGSIQSARGAGLYKLVAHNVLQDHAAYRQADASQDQGGQTGQAAGRER